MKRRGYIPRRFFAIVQVEAGIMKQYIVDAFADAVFHGNPAAAA